MDTSTVLLENHDVLDCAGARPPVPGADVTTASGGPSSEMIQEQLKRVLVNGKYEAPLLRSAGDEMPNRRSMVARAMTLAFFVTAAFFEIAGCFAFWSYFRLGRPSWTLGLGVLSLVLFAYALTRVDASYAGRAYAAYGGIYVASSLVWLRVVEGARPDRWDMLGSAICVVGALVIIFWRR